VFQVISKCFVSLNNYTGQSWLIFCRHPLTQICVQPDAQRKTNGLSGLTAYIVLGVVRVVGTMKKPWRAELSAI
jgi:hypothetical protein